MSNEHQTSVFMNGTGDAPQTDASSGGRLLSTSGEDKSPRVRMTKPARFRVKIIVLVLLILIIAIAVILIIALTAKGNGQSGSEVDHTDPTSLSHYHVRCKHDVMIASKGSNVHWRNIDSSAHEWRTFPNVKNTGYVLISPKYRLEANYPGIQVSMLLPHDITEFHVMAVTPPTHHSKAVTMVPSSNRCNSIVLDDPSFFNGNKTVFYVYIFYRRQVVLEGAKFTVTSLPQRIHFKSVKLYSKPTTSPNFTHIGAEDRDKCSVEIHNSDVQCDWWNVEDGDNADFTSLETHECISSGIQSGKSDTWFFGLTSSELHHESRALLVSPILKRVTPSVLMSMWVIFKCEDLHIKIHLVPTTGSLHDVIGSSSVVAEVTSQASHSDWEFLSYQIILPEEHKAYHIVIEGIVQANGNCTNHQCTFDGLQFSEPKAPTFPVLGLDGITLELMHEQCESTNNPKVMDCTFQTGDGAGTQCDWESSLPANAADIDNQFLGANFWQDWKVVNSGDEDDHGATAQHFVGRGHVMTFDATGRSGSQSYLRTPLLQANKNCSCVMTYLYLMRGVLAPRMQLNLIYGTDLKDEKRVKEPQWSLLGHQSEEWEKAVVAINMKTNSPFQVELRVLDVYDGRADVHFDDVHFVGCDMEKYTTS